MKASKCKKIIVLLSFFIANYNLLLAVEYQPLKTEQIAEIVHSTKRIVVPLLGTWEKSTNNGSSWSRIDVPCTGYEEGQVIYKKEIRIDKDTYNNKNLHLFFSGLAGQVDVYFNNEFVIKIDGKFLPINIPIPKKMLIYGSNNEIRLVFLKNSDIDFLQSLYVMNAPASQAAKGIIREPFLIATSPIYINELKHKFTNNLSNLHFNMSCTADQVVEKIIENDEEAGTITNKKINVTVEYLIINKRTNDAVTSLASKDFLIENLRTIDLKFDIATSHLRHWSLDSPELYKLVVRLKQNGVLMDEYFVNIGKREVAKNKEGKITLNGKTVEIKSVLYNECFGTVGNTISAYRFEEDIKNIKLLGVNTIRLQFFIPNPYLIYICEKYGMMVLMDLPLSNINKNLLKNEEFVTQIKHTFTRFLQRSYSNSASLIGIGIGSSVIECKEFNTLAQQLISLTKNYKKLIYKVVELGTENFSETGYDLLIFNTNTSFNNIEKIKKEIDRIKEQCKLPLVFGFSSRVKPGNLNGYSDPTSNEYQAFFIKNCYNLSVQARLAGFLIYSYNDYLTNYPILALDYRNQYLETTGITDVYHKNKNSVKTIIPLLHNERLPLLNLGTYENENLITYIVIGLVLLLLFLFMFNRYSRFREYLIRAFLRPENFFADIRDLRIMSIIQTLILGLIIALSISLCLGSVTFNLRGDINYSYFITVLFPFRNILEILFKSAWQPELLLIFFSVIVVAILFINAILIRILASILRARLFTDDTITISIWAVLPFILLLPLGIILAKLILISDVFIFIFFILFIIMVIWSIHRLFKSVAIIFAKSFIQVYSFGIVFFVITVLIPIIYYENEFGLMSFIEYFIYMP
jgi:beta-galactosidase